MSRRRALPALAATGALLAATAGIAPAPAAAADPFETVPLVFTVEVGPEGDQRECEVVGDLRIPAGVSAGRPAPGAVLATNGFGGDKDGTGPNGNGAYGARFAEQGYVTLSYSGLGFGGSSCQIYVDDPAYDGVAGSQLVSFLGGAKGIATRDGEPYDIAGLVRLDSKGSDGKPHAHDPRVAMIGGSYGGQIQFAVAAVDPRMDALAPIYTWNDLGYALAPNNAGGSGTQVRSPEVPGVWKAGWHSLFFGLGFGGPVLYPGNEPGVCGGYTDWICQAFAELSTVGVPSATTVEHVRDVSVGYYMDKVKIPVLLSQGQKDSLFNINEAVASYDQLRAQGNTVRMVWQSWGHTVGDPAPGELDAGTLEPGSADLRTTVQGQIFTDWMAHWLKDAQTDLGPAVRYFRDYAYTAPSDASDEAAALRAATAAYGSAPAYPVGKPAALRLSGSGALVGPGEQVQAGSAAFATTGATGPTSSGEAVTGSAPPQVDAPGTFARFTSSPQTAPLDVAGIPELTLQLSAPQVAAAQGSSPLGKLLLFAKLYDVAPDGSRTLVKDLVSASRVPDVTEPVRITMPGIVHRFDTGHSVQLVVSAADATYKGTGLAGPVTVVTGPESVSALSLPSVNAAPATRPVAAPAQRPAAAAPAAPAPATGALPATGASTLLPLAGLLLLGGVLVARRRRA